jgi:hypothetical protein
VPTNPLSKVLPYLHEAALSGGASGISDGRLLDLFVNGGEDAALKALVQRHSKMVWGVCRRLLTSHHDAEDAFQATFLVLVRKASSILPREKVASWLYGVAKQTKHDRYWNIGPSKPFNPWYQPAIDATTIIFSN